MSLPFFLRHLARRLLAILLPLAIVATVYLYLYPIFHGCAFPVPPSVSRGGSSHGTNPNPLWSTLRQHIAPASVAADEPAIFRLLVLADPQLEGDTSLPSKEYELLARVREHWGVIKGSMLRGEDVQEEKEEEKEENQEENQEEGEGEEDDNGSVFLAISAVWDTFVYEDIPRTLRAAQKRLDLLGNDYYLAHIYRTLHWWTRPSHVTVLGDLIGSQWVTDGEFESRGSRYWNRVFRGGERVSDEITRTGRKGYELGEKSKDDSRLQQLERGDSTWTRKIINVAGNHDIGYSGDVSETRLERFERVFGRANWDVRFQHPVDLRQGSDDDDDVTPTLHLINLNTLTLDSPALSPDIQSDSYNYINDLIAHRTYPVGDRTTFTLLLTHLPLHKEDGICTDGPYFQYHDSDDDDGPDGVPRFKEGGLREQNHLSDQLSAKGVLEGIFGLSGDEDSAGGGRGRNGLILTGHDHTGCDVVYFVDRSNSTSTDDDGQTQDESQSQSQSESWAWQAKRYHNTTADIPKDSPSIREVTLRSMMGEFGGNAGLLSVWFDANTAVNEWKYEITTCAAGVQHIWWAVHVVDIVTVVVFFVSVVVSGLGPGSSSPLAKVDRGQALHGKEGSPNSQPRVNGNGKATDKVDPKEQDSKKQ